MASADFSWQALLRDSEIHPPHVHETSPVMDILFPSYTTLICVVISSMPTSLISSFCASGQMFAAGFLQIPTHGGHPCLGLYTSRYRACYGLTPIRECSCWANNSCGVYTNATGAQRICGRKKVFRPSIRVFGKEACIYCEYSRFVVTKSPASRRLSVRRQTPPPCRRGFPCTRVIFPFFRPVYVVRGCIRCCSRGCETPSAPLGLVPLRGGTV